MEGALREAEHHYVEAQEWHSAVNMYRSNELWDDAIRVAKFYGGLNASKRVTIALLMAIGVPEGTKYLLKHGLVEAAIEHATENAAFELAFELANLNMPKLLPGIYLKHALFLEDDEKFKEAEEEFVKANKPREAIDMYLHQQVGQSVLDGIIHILMTMLDRCVLLFRFNHRLPSSALTPHFVSPLNSLFIVFHT